MRNTQVMRNRRLISALEKRESTAKNCSHPLLGMRWNIKENSSLYGRGLSRIPQESRLMFVSNCVFWEEWILITTISLSLCYIVSSYLRPWCHRWQLYVLHGDVLNV